MIALAKQAALAAGDVLLKHYGNIPDEMIRQKTENDFLSFVDEESEQVIIKTIRSRYPQHAFLAEEGGAIENERKTHVGHFQQGRPGHVSPGRLFGHCTERDY